MRLDTDVDPWMDEVFTTGAKLRPATIYTAVVPTMHMQYCLHLKIRKMRGNAKSIDSVSIRCLQRRALMIIAT